MSNLIDSEITKTDHVWESGRYKTFKKWPFTSNAKCLPVNMSAAGWYCTSHDPDDPTAKCVFCLKELSGWEPTDDPWDEHIKHSAECLFAKLGKKESDLTVREIISLVEQRQLKLMEIQFKADLKKLEELKEKILVVLEDKYGVKTKQGKN